MEDRKTKEGDPAVRLSRHDRALVLFSWVGVALDRYPSLRWNWFIEQTIQTDEDVMTVAGDDHAVRLFRRVESAAGKEHSMEIIWGNRALRRGDWRHLEFFMGMFSFPHYTANGGDENAGRWHHERVNLRELYTTLWGDVAGAHLIALALFCDTDETGAESTAYFADIRVATEP